MKKNKNSILKLVKGAAFVVAITAVNRCFEKNESALVKRDLSAKQLNRQLSIVNLVYHAIGIFYNE